MATIIFDFDGVIHSYKSGWQGVDVIKDEPVKGIKECIEKLRLNGYKIVVFSTRCSCISGVEAIKSWLKKYEIKVDDVSYSKVPAILTVDDRCVCFDGNPDTLIEKIKNFKVWPKQKDDILKRRRQNIEALIKNVEYAVFGQKTTVCHIITHFNFEFIGKAFCANADDFNEAVGQKTAYEDALRQMEESLLFTEAFNNYASLLENA